MTISTMLRSLHARASHNPSSDQATAENRVLSMRPTVYLPPALAEKFLRRLQRSHSHADAQLGTCPALCGA